MVDVECKSWPARAFVGAGMVSGAGSQIHTPSNILERDQHHLNTTDHWDCGPAHKAPGTQPPQAKMSITL